MKIKFIRFQGWKGNIVDAYFGDLEKGEWVNIGIFKYLYLWSKCYIVRIKIL